MAKILLCVALRLAVSEIQHAQGQRKSEMDRMAKNWTWTLNSEKEFIHTKILTPEAQILVRFTLRLAVSEIQQVQGRQKSEKHQMTPNWNWTLNSPKYSI